MRTQFVRNQDPMDAMKLGHYRERMIKNKVQELSSALKSIVSNKKFYQPEIETQSQYDAENDIFQVQARITYKGYWFVLDWKGNPAKGLYSSLWGKVAKAPSNTISFDTLKEATQNLKSWIELA